MAAELQTLAAASVSRKRKPDHKPGKKPSKRVKQKASSMAAAKPRKPSRKMRKLFRKRAREYHSDEEEESDEESSSEEEESDRDLDVVDDDGSGGSERDDDDDGEGAQHGITRFVEGCRAFRVAFMKIMKKHLPDDPLGPILSAHKKLVAEKLAEEVSEHKTKAEMKKEKQMEAERGHVKAANFLDAREKLLISVATKGEHVVLDEKKSLVFTIAFRLLMQFCDSKSMDKNSELGWAPLRNNYMLTSSKLKDWDKMPEAAAVVDHKQISSESSSDED
ncbi:Rrp15p [Musa troglodytarum]|uniref:Rrp15p n=1 Tax=Musa troglodytarum TaxID=320322 RepID=A0A9E7HC91_9LILI|nr:Rrp15p [Musa troglodytarum]